jgi:hypothetical protein
VDAGANAALGNSEGLLVALALAAVDPPPRGPPSTLSCSGFGAALLRPEAWAIPRPLRAVAALARARRATGSVIAGFAALPLLWLLPSCGVGASCCAPRTGATTPRANSAAFADDPIVEVVRQFGTMLTPALWVGLGALVAMMVAAPRLGRRERRAVIGWRLAAARLGRRGRRDDQRRLQRQRALPDHARGVACVLAGTASAG